MKGIFLMSGGTTPVINASLAGVLSSITEDKSSKHKLFTSKNGIFGVIKGEFEEVESHSDFIRYAYSQPGSAITGTSRVGFLSEKDIELIDKNFERMNFDFVINVGGNGTLQQSRALSNYFKDKYLIANCPKTVDNDLGDFEMKEVFFTPGFPSCVNWWNRKLNFFNIENQGAFSHDKVLVLQTFGRETGFISGAVGINTEYENFIVNMLPEAKADKYKYLEKILSKIKNYGRCIVLISEGHFSKDLDNNLDQAGQIQFSGGRSTSAQLLVEFLIKNGINSRSVIPGIMQRVFKDEILEYDRQLAFAQGFECMNNLKKGENNFLMSISKRTEDKIPSLTKLNFLEKSEFSRNLSKDFINNLEPSILYSKYLNEINLTKGLFEELIKSKLNL